MSIQGFTILRNGTKYDYPFRESLQSLAMLTENVYLALGAGEDDTEEQLSKHPYKEKLRLIHTEWDQSLRESGLILSQQTNIALKALRKKSETGWAIYLQADEVFNDSDYSQILRDLQRADAQSCDAVSFRYLHFWQRFDRIAYAKRWYPQEVRAIRIEGEGESYGDAQSFRGTKKIYQSDVAVFHYGHVRTPEKYALKQRDFHRWWHNDLEMTRVLAAGKKRDAYEPTLRYLGPHPSFMQERVKQLGGIEPSLSPNQDVLVWGESEDALGIRVTHPRLHWSTSVVDLFAYKPEHVVLLEPFSLVQSAFCGLRYRSRVPEGLMRRDARPWTPSFKALMRFSERGISASAII